MEWNEHTLLGASAMRITLVTLLSLPAAIYGAPTPEGTFEQIWDALPRSTSANITCPATPNPMPKVADLPVVKTMPDPFLYLDMKTRVQSKDEWYQCRQPEIMKLLQEYQYGYYPDHSKETVTATRSGTTLTVSVAAGGKTASIKATLVLPSGSGPFPVIIAIGGIDNAAYTKAGIAVVTFDYSSVAADSNTKSGSFWTLYNGKDIGMALFDYTSDCTLSLYIAGVLTAWAWGFHRVLDGIEQKVPEIDAKKNGVTGCSRLGKAALAAGLFDTRITVTIPVCSGVQGAGPYRYSLSGQGENLENSVWTNRLSLGAYRYTDSGHRSKAHPGGQPPTSPNSSSTAPNSPTTATPSSPPSRLARSS